jgi:hypothetical protein
MTEAIDVVIAEISDEVAEALAQAKDLPRRDRRARARRVVESRYR